MWEEYPVQVTEALRHAAVAHQPQHLVQRLRGQRPEVPHQGLVAEATAGIALLGVDEVRELDRIANEEDRRVVADHVVVAVLGVVLESEAARVAPRIGRALLAGDGGEAQEGVGLLADLAEEIRLRPPGHVVGDLEVAVGCGALGVDDALRNPLTVEVGHLLEHVAVLHQDRTALADGDGVVVVRRRSAVVVGTAVADLRHLGLLRRGFRVVHPLSPGRTCGLESSLDSLLVWRQSDLQPAGWRARNGDWDLESVSMPELPQPDRRRTPALTRTAGHIAKARDPRRLRRS